jgi:hypothetical protein
MARKTGITTETKNRYFYDAAIVYKNYDFDTGLGTLLGATRGGASFAIEREVKEVEVDGLLGKAKGFRRIITENAAITVNMMEWTDETFLSALPACVSATEGGYKKITCSRDIIEGDYIDNIVMVVKKSNGQVARFAILNALADGGLEIGTTDKEETVPSVVFSAHYDPDGDLDARPYRIDDPTSAVVYSVIYTAGANGTIVGNATQSIVSGQNATTVVATPAVGYVFLKWSDNDSTVASRTATNVTANINAVAIFEQS